MTRHFNVSWCVAVCNNMLQCGVVYCSVMCSVLQCTALQCMSYSVLYCVAACCSVLQRVTVRCSVLQSVSSIVLQQRSYAKSSAHFCEFVFLQRCACVVFVTNVRFLSRTGVGADVCNALLIS